MEVPRSTVTTDGLAGDADTKMKRWTGNVATSYSISWGPVKQLSIYKRLFRPLDNRSTQASITTQSLPLHLAAMLLLQLILVSYLLLDQVSCVVETTDTLPMTLWNPTNDDTNEYYSDSPTWTATTTPGNVPGRIKNLEVSFQDVLDLARMYWNWLKIEQPKGWQTGDARGGDSLVSTTE